MISRFNEIIPFDRPSSPGRPHPLLPDLPSGFPGILKGKHLNQNVLIARPVAISLFPLGLRVYRRDSDREKRRKMPLKKSPKNLRGRALWFREKDGYVCARSTKVSFCLSFYPIAVTLNPSPFSLLPRCPAAAKFIIIDMFKCGRL